MVAQKGRFEHDWHDREENVTLDRTDIEFGEINNKYINNEFDATIVEVAFHDNKQDAELMRDPLAREATARATYHGLVKYFAAVDGNKTPATTLPLPVIGVRAESLTPGSATVSWLGYEASSFLGDAPSGYRVYASTNGYGFDGGTSVTGKHTRSVVLSGLDPTTVYYFNVAAVNEGGDSAVTETVAATPSGEKDVLIVNGFDRLDRELDPTQSYQGKTVDRVRPRQSNSRDYVVQVATAIQSAAPGAHIASASNEAVISGAINLSDYRSVIWILGNESTRDHTFDSAEQKKVEQFIDRGGNLFVSGSNIGWDLDEKKNGRPFYRETLKAKFVADSAKTYDVAGAAGSIFEGLKFSFDDGSQIYDVGSPDVIAAQEGAHVALDYANAAGAAAIQAAGNSGRGSVVVIGFPFETITSAADRAEVMRRVLRFFHL